MSGRKSTKATTAVQPLGKKRNAATSTSTGRATVPPAKMTKVTVPTSTSPTVASTANPSEWDELPAVPLDIVMSYLRVKENNEDLCNMRQVCTRFKSSVDGFMCRPTNRPDFHSVTIEKTSTGVVYGNASSISLSVSFHATDLPFMDLSTIDWTDLERSREGELAHFSYTDRAGKKTQIAKFHAILSSLPSIDRLHINLDWRATNFALISSVLGSTIFNQVLFNFGQRGLTDDFVANIKQILTSTTATTVEITFAQSDVTDLPEFITDLSAISTKGVALEWDHGRFYDLPADYWKDLLTEKLALPGGRVWANDRELKKNFRLGNDYLKKVEWRKEE